MTTTDRIQQANDSLQAAGLPLTVTADQLSVPVSPSAFTKRQQAENAKLLMDWRTAVAQLPIDPTLWTAHLAKIKRMGFLKPAQMIAEFENLKKLGYYFGLGFDAKAKAFYLMAVPDMDEEAADRLARQLFPERF